MTAEQYLEQVKSLDSIIANRYRDHRDFFESALSIGGSSFGERVQSSPNPHRGTNTIDTYIDIEREIAELKKKRKSIISDIESLPRFEYKVLYLLYVAYNESGEDYSLKEVAYELKKSYDWVKKKKRLALRDLQRILDEREAEGVYRQGES